MYSVCACINDVEVVKIPLDVKGGRFLPDTDAVRSPFRLCRLELTSRAQIMHALSTLSPPPKLIFLTSPGNPTGTCIPVADVRRIAEHPTWRGLVIVDEAYIDFSDPENDGSNSAITLYGTLCAFAKAFAHALVQRQRGLRERCSDADAQQGVRPGGHQVRQSSSSICLAVEQLHRLGYSVSAPGFAQVLTNAKAPYNIPSPTAALALRALEPSVRAEFSLESAIVT